MMKSSIAHIDAGIQRKRSGDHPTRNQIDIANEDASLQGTEHTLLVKGLFQNGLQALAVGAGVEIDDAVNSVVAVQRFQFRL